MLGFLSLIVSYAKEASAESDTAERDRTLEELVQVTPHNDFTTLYSMVKSTMKMKSGSLYGLIKVLACYKNTGTSVIIDTKFCTGTASAPQPNGRMDLQYFRALSRDLEGSNMHSTKFYTCTAKDWINSIENEVAPDRLTKLNRVLDRALSVDEDQMETFGDTKSKVPLFEFKYLKNMEPSDFFDRISNAEVEVLEKHAKNSRYIRRSLDAKYPIVKRNSSDTCIRHRHSEVASTGAFRSTTTASPTIMSAPITSLCTLQNEDPDQGINAQGYICGSVTLPLLTVTSVTDETQSCAYTALPSSTVSNPITVESQTYTSNCQACTLVGGIADSPSSTTVAGCSPTAAPPSRTSSGTSPTLAVHLSNNSVSMGDEDSINNGAALSSNLQKCLQNSCPNQQATSDQPGTCTSTTNSQINNVASLDPSNDQPDTGTINITVQDSRFNSAAELNQMIVAAVVVTASAVSKSCTSETYRSQPWPATQNECTTGPVTKRRLGSSDGLLEDRSPIREDPCLFTAHLCAGPDHVHVELGNATDPYANWMDISIGWTVNINSVSAFEKFICELIIEGLTALAMAMVPELANTEVLADVELTAMCGDPKNLGQPGPGNP